MRFTAEQRDKLLKDNYVGWLLAYQTQDAKLMHTIQLLTKAYHNQKCTCATKAVMNKLKTYYIKSGLYEV